LRRLAALAFLAGLAGCAADPPVAPPATPGGGRLAAGASPPIEVALENAGFEAPPPMGRSCPRGWGCTTHSDPHSFTFEAVEVAGGRKSLRIERVRPEPWALVTQVVRDPRLPGARVRLSMNLRLEGVTGGAGPMVLSHDGRGAGIGNARDLLDGTRDWTRAQVEFRVPREAVILEVGATLEGPGRAWVDGVRLEILELARNP
jgi:hypothetical protein